MKAINRFILEKLKISNKPKYTLRNFIEWYINKKLGQVLVVNDIRILDFTRSPDETWQMFDRSSTNMAKFLLKHLDDNIELTEDVNKEEKSITYTFYIDDILFVVLAVYNTCTTYPAFFDQYFNESLVSEKLKISSNTDQNTDAELKELANAWDIWKRTQKQKYPEFKLRNIYKSLHIEQPSIKCKYNTNSDYYIYSIRCYKRMDGGCNVTLYYKPTFSKVLMQNVETRNYDELIDLLGNGNVKDGDTIYAEILNKLVK